MNIENKNDAAMSIRMPKSTHEELRKLAFKTRLSINEIINKSIKEYLARTKIK